MDQCKNQISAHNLRNTFIVLPQGNTKGMPLKIHVLLNYSTAYSIFQYAIQKIYQIPARCPIIITPQ